MSETNGYRSAPRIGKEENGRLLKQVLRAVCLRRKKCTRPANLQQPAQCSFHYVSPCNLDALQESPQWTLRVRRRGRGYLFFLLRVQCRSLVNSVFRTNHSSAWPAVWGRAANLCPCPPVPDIAVGAGGEQSRGGSGLGGGNLQRGTARPRFSAAATVTMTVSFLT